MRLIVTLLVFLASSPALALTMLLAAGANRSFDPALPPLTYAASDAEQFAAAMRGVSLVPGDLSVVAPNPTRADLLAAFAEARRTFANDEGIGSQKFIFYFSGHADERGLHLKDALLAKDELHAQLEQIAAKTKVVILDSCYAGALAMKGVRPIGDKLAAPKIALDEPAGTIFLTAASARDVALESATTGGSLFTHTLIAGLYGAADTTGNGVVTATALYEYAYRQTQLSSFMLPVGAPQKPELIADLKGRGAVILAMPQGRIGHLRLPEATSGKVAVQALAGVASVELAKQAGTTADVPLPAGAYRVWVRDGQRTGTADVDIKVGRVAMVTPADIAWRSGDSLAMAKGAPVAAAAPRRVHASAALLAEGPWELRSGVGGELAVAGDRDGEAAGVEVMISQRSSTRGDSDPMRAGQDIAEARTAAYLGYLFRPVDPARHSLIIAFDLGLGAARSAMHRTSAYDCGFCGADGPTAITQENDNYVAARGGVRISVATDRVWLTAVHEQRLSPLTAAAHPMIPATWDSLGLGFTL